MSTSLIMQASVKVPATGGTSERLDVSSTAVQSSTFSNNTTAFVVCDVDVYVRQGVSPVAVASGVDVFLPAGSWRLDGILDENKLSFVTTGDVGTVHITPGA